MKMIHRLPEHFIALLVVAVIVRASPFMAHAQKADPADNHEAFLQRRSEAKQVLDAAGVQYKSFFVQSNGTYAVTLLPSVTNLNALAGLPVSSLKLFMCTNMVDISGVTNLPLLKAVHIEGVRGTDLAPLAHTRIEELFLRGTEISDFTPLKGLPLKTLTSNGAWFKDISCLRGMPLENLNIEYTGVTDLIPLKGMKIQELGIIGSRVTDLRPLEGMQLRGITLTPYMIDNGYDALRRMTTLEGVYIPYRSLTMAEFWKRLDAGEFRNRTEPEN